MSQVHCYLPEEIAVKLQRRAKSLGMSVSAYLTTLVKREVEVDTEWPEDFFEKVVGGWKGEPLTRPPQGEFEVREKL